MGTEELIREVVSKVCPFHGKRAAVSVPANGRIQISACCDEFHHFLENQVKNKFQHEATKTGSFEIMLDI